MWIKVRSSVIHLVVCSLLVGHDVRMYVRMREMRVISRNADASEPGRGSPVTF